jgi:hypothetical protein
MIQVLHGQKNLKEIRTVEVTINCHTNVSKHLDITKYKSSQSSLPLVKR